MADLTGKEKLKALFDKVQTVAEDLTTLEVTTLTGDINLLLKEEGEGDNQTFKFVKKDALMKLIGDNAKLGENSKISIVAYSSIDLDQDAVNFVKANMSDGEIKLYQLHLDSIKASQEARAGFLKFLVGLFDQK